jgi:hypothetical protein
MAQCQRCGRELAPGSAVCEGCGALQQPPPSPPSYVARGPANPGNRYPILRFAQTIIRVLAWISLVVGPIVGLVAGARNGFGGAVGGLIGGGIAGALYWVMLLAYAELISVALDIEINTRTAAEATAHLAQRQ